ncbi:MAG TPA: enoyl-CoA hydratase-related protein [bacterium]|jgi:2-(1,2-epoxy-1,2-dihydrophenyl)acetyl-CoA isomerase
MDKSISELVLSHREGAVGTVSLNRSESLNAFNLDLARQFLRIIEDYRQDDGIRVVVVRGEGRVFSAGGDIPEMLGYVRDGKDRAAYFRAPLTAFGRMVLALRAIPKPIVAAVHGAVAGFAFNLMLACDLKLAEEKTRFSQAFIKVGLSPDGGGTWFLPRYVGYTRACELAMLPTELDAKSAQEWGLINWTAPAMRFEARLKEITDAIANSPREALGRAKELLYGAYDRGLAEHIEAERLAQVENAASPDFEEGLTAFVEKRGAKFWKPRP